MTFHGFWIKCNTYLVSSVPNRSILRSHNRPQAILLTTMSARTKNICFHLVLEYSLQRDAIKCLQRETRPNTGTLSCLLISIKTTVHQFSDHSKCRTYRKFQIENRQHARHCTKWQLSQSYVPAQWTPIAICHWLSNIVSDINKTTVHRSQSSMYLIAFQSVIYRDRFFLSLSSFKWSQSVRLTEVYIDQWKLHQYLHFAYIEPFNS